MHMFKWTANISWVNVWLIDWLIYIFSCHNDINQSINHWLTWHWPLTCICIEMSIDCLIVPKQNSLELRGFETFIAIFLFVTRSLTRIHGLLRRGVRLVNRESSKLVLQTFSSLEPKQQQKSLPPPKNFKAQQIPAWIIFFFPRQLNNHHPSHTFWTCQENCLHNWNHSKFSIESINQSIEVYHSHLFSGKKRKKKIRERGSFLKNDQVWEVFKSEI